jgi:hypothetical protein
MEPVEPRIVRIFMDGAVARDIPPSYHAVPEVYGVLLLTSNPRPVSGVPGRIASGVFFIRG